MNAAVIVAAGQGLRMGGPVRKQYLSLRGLPILSHCLRVFDDTRLFHQIVLVVPENEFEFCKQHVLSPISPRTLIRLVAGGAIRQKSVYNGLRALPAETRLAAIHDGVRPFITPAQIQACVQEAEIHHACILGIPVTDTLKRVCASATIVNTIDRDNLWIAQTPQVFDYKLILRAHERAAQSGVSGTDDAMLVELTGHTVKIIQGSRHNIKITTPDDITMAEALIHAAVSKQGR